MTIVKGDGVVPGSDGGSGRPGCITSHVAEWSVESSRFYPCRRTVMEMPRDRGCNVSDSDLRLSLTEFLSEFGPNPDHERLSVCVPLRSKPSKKISDLLVNITKHVSQPKLEILTAEEKKKLLMKYNLEDKKALTVAARRLLTNAIQQCAGKLESGIKQFLISSMSGDIKSENHQIDCHQVIYHTDQLETRLIAVSLVGDLSYLPGSTISEAFQPISPEFLKRLTDGVVDVRMLAVQHVKSCKLQSNPFRAEAPEIISALCDHFYQKVRNQVVAVVYDVACHALNSIPLKAIKQVAERLRDKSQAASCLSESSSKVEKPLPFVAYAAAIGAAAAAEAMAAGLADPAGADPDDDEGGLTDEDDGDDLEGDANNEMEEDEDNNGDDGNGGGVGVLVEIVGYGLQDPVARIDLQQVPNAAALDQRVQDELVRHQLPNDVQPPDRYNIIYVVQQGLHQEIQMTLQDLAHQVGWDLNPIVLRRIVAQPILNPRWVDVVRFQAQDREVIGPLDITGCENVDALLGDLQFLLEEVEFRTTVIIDLPLHPNNEMNLVELGEIQPWIIAVQRILEIQVTIENNGGPPSLGSEDSTIED